MGRHHTPSCRPPGLWRGRRPRWPGPRHFAESSAARRVSGPREEKHVSYRRSLQVAEGWAMAARGAPEPPLGTWSGRGHPKASERHPSFDLAWRPPGPRSEEDSTPRPPNLPLSPVSCLRGSPAGWDSRLPPGSLTSLWVRLCLCLWPRLDKLLAALVLQAQETGRGWSCNCSHQMSPRRATGAWGCSPVLKWGPRTWQRC